MNLDELTEELTCPLTLSLLSDPITLPCCGKAVSRSPLRSALTTSNHQHHQHHQPSCPLCRTEISLDFAETAPRNRVAQALLDGLASAAASAATTTAAAPESSSSSSSSSSTVGGMMKMTNSQDEEAPPKLTATYCLLPVPTTKSTTTNNDESSLSVPQRRQQQTSDDDSTAAISMSSSHNKNNTSAFISSSRSRIGRLQLKVTNAAALNLRRNLSILVVDKSGSMAGSPWKQASLAMKHIVSMATELSHFSVNTTLKIVCYDSRASELNCHCGQGGSVDQVHARIDQTRAGGSTSFRAAFQETLRVMRRTVTQAQAMIQQHQVPEGTVSPMPGVVQILFLTDGQAHEDRTQLAEELRTQLAKFRADFAAQHHDNNNKNSRIGGATTTNGVVPDVTVHAVGFSANCDRTLLDRIRKAGTTHPGQFRYCEPGDSEDALCGRLTGMFESMAAHGGCELTVERLATATALLPSPNGGEQGLAEQQPQPQPQPLLPQQQTWDFLGQDGEILPPRERGRIRLQLRTKPDGVGTAVAWVSLNVPPQEASASASSALVLPIAVHCNVGQERAPPMEEDVEEDNNESPSQNGNGNDLDENACPLPSSLLFVVRRPDFTVTAREDRSFSSVDAVKRAWVGARLHVIAEDAIACASAATHNNKSSPLAVEAVRLWGAFLEHRLRAVSALGSDSHGRVPGLLEQLRGLSNWKKKKGPNCNNNAEVVSIGRLRDLSSASAFSSSRAPAAASSAPVATQRPRGASASATSAGGKKHSSSCLQQATTATVANSSESIIFIEGNNETMKRNSLQSAIMNWGQRKGADAMVSALLHSMNNTESQEEALIATDASGNTAAHLAAYFGQFDALPVLLEAAPSSPDTTDMPNDYGETPITIAIKRRGYHKTVEVLQNLGASIPEDRIDGLIEFCVRWNYPRTAAFLKKRKGEKALGPTGNVKSGKTKPSWTLQSAADLPALAFEEGTAPAVVEIRLKNAMSQGRPVDWVSLVRVALQLPHLQLLKSGLEHIKPEDIDPEWIFTYCFPRKPDAEDTPLFLELFELVLDFVPPSLLMATQPESGDTLLHRAVHAGSLAHTEFLVARGVNPDVTNRLGNTPLIVSCTKRYPCIADFFIATGADINAPNSKGVTPIAAAAQMGSLRIVESLISAGATVDGSAVVTNTGENLLHLAIRANRPDILELLLDRTDPDTMLEIDRNGFTPILASVEGDRKECLSLLLDSADEFYRCGFPGFDTADTTTMKSPILEWKTPKDSPIIPEATALHIAVYFGRKLVSSALLGRGADPNAVDGNGLTPLHLAAQHGNVDAVYTLVSHGANPSAVDKTGRTAASYGRSFSEVMAALVGPIPEPLHAFAAGFMEASALSACADVVKRAASVAAEPGLLDAPRVLDLTLDDIGQTALMVAVSHGNMTAVDALFQSGSSPKKRDRRGLSAEEWAQMIKSQRMMGILSVPPRPLLPGAERLRQWNGVDAMAVFVGGRFDPSRSLPTSTTTLHFRLVLLAEAFGKVERSEEHEREVSSSPTTSLLLSAPRTGSVDRLTIAPTGSAEQYALDADRWFCKIAAAGVVAGGSKYRPKHVFVTLLATQHGALLPKLNDFLEEAPSTTTPAKILTSDKSKFDFAVALFDALKELPSSVSVSTSSSISSSNSDYLMMEEVYAIAPPGLARASLSEGSEVTLNGFASATMEWPIALSALDSITRCHGNISGGTTGSFGTGKGIVLIIRTPQSSRVVWPHSAFPEDREVIFLPGTRFRVNKWYRGGELPVLQVLLGQRNARDKVPRLGNKEISQLLVEDAGSSSQLLIELEEIII